jgi:hypothetical protein
MVFRLQQMQQSTFKIALLLCAGAFFSGCSMVESNDDSVDIATFQVLESKVAVLEREKEKFEEMYAVLREESSKQEDIAKSIEGGEKIDFLENEVTKLSQDYESQKLELTQALQKIENLEEILSDMELGLTTHAAADENPRAIRANTNTAEKNNTSEEKSDEKTGGSDDSGEKVSAAPVVYIQDSARDGERFLVFEKCDDNGSNCEKYVVSEQLLQEEIVLTEKKGVKFLLSGGIEYLGKVSNEDYYSVITNVVLVEILGSGPESDE